MKFNPSTGAVCFSTCTARPAWGPSAPALPNNATASFGTESATYDSGMADSETTVSVIFAVGSR